MTARQARRAKHDKAMARLYCYRDGTKPGPELPTHLAFRNIYKGVFQSFFAITTPLIEQIKAMPNGSSLLSGSNTAYFDVKK